MRRKYVFRRGTYKPRMPRIFGMWFDSEKDRLCVGGPKSVMSDVVELKDEVILKRLKRVQVEVFEERSRFRIHFHPIYVDRIKYIVNRLRSLGWSVEEVTKFRRLMG